MIWKDVVGYEGYYQVSRYGQVRSVDRVVPHSRCGTQVVGGRVLRPTRNIQTGYLMAELWLGGVRRKKTIHSLVMESHVGTRPEGKEVLHGPNGIDDNSVSNLSYGTRSQNNLDTRRDGTHGGRPVRRSDGVEFINMHVAADETGCSQGNIWSCCNGRRKTTGGYGWEYADKII